MKETEADIWEDAYEIERTRRHLVHLENALAKKAEERGITETQLCGIKAAMKVRVDEELGDMQDA